MRLALLFALFTALPAAAEAGSPLMWCGTDGCSCRQTTCSCGQVCNQSTGACQSAQSGYCASDASCAATCDSFICEGNICVKGVRTDGGGGTTTPAPSGGCSSTGMFGVGLGLLVGMRRWPGRRP